MNVAIFGGSFDPPHFAHIEVLKYLIAQNKFDEVWVIPSKKNPLKPTQSRYSDRIKMCQLAFEEINPSIKIIEEEKELTGFTIDLIQHLKKKFPEHHFTFLGGSDLQQEMQQWKDHEELKKQIQFEFFPRPPQPSPFPNISSTEIRQSVKKQLPIDHFVLKAVAEYIRQHHLYQNSYENS